MRWVLILKPSSHWLFGFFSSTFPFDFLRVFLLFVFFKFYLSCTDYFAFGSKFVIFHNSPWFQKTPGKIPVCKVCNKEFKSRTILYRHRQTHMEKTIQCGACQKLFSTVSQVQSHQAKLKHEKIFKCAPCNLTFTAVMELKVSLM